MSRFFCALPLPCPVAREPERRRSPRRISGLASSASLAAAVLVAPFPAVAGVDWSACLHATDPSARAAACTDIIENTSERKTLLRALNARGNALCATAERCREAVQDFTAVVKLAPDTAGYHDNLARALRAATRYEEALKESDRAIGLAPKLAFVYVGKARTLEAAGREGEALAIVQSTMALVAVDAGLLEYEGKLLGELKRYQESYAAFERALQMQPTRMSVYIRRADAEAAEGRSAAAISDLERYPLEGPEAGEVRSKLDVLRNSPAKKFAGSVEAVDPHSKQNGGVGATLEPNQNKVSSSDASRSTADVAVAAPQSTVNEACNLYSFTPLQRCIEDYHNENDPLPGGLANPRRWNDELAARGRTLAARHPDVTWDPTRWRAISEEEADKRHALVDADSAKVVHGLPPASGSPATEVTTEQRGEVEACNDPKVLSTMTADLDDFKAAFKKMNADLKSSSWGRDSLGTFDRWSVSIHNIRQQSYDPTNNVRYCSADYLHSGDFLSGLKLMSAFVRIPSAKGICADAVTYKVEHTLDTPGGVYVTHFCQ